MRGQNSLVIIVTTKQTKLKLRGQLYQGHFSALLKGLSSLIRRLLRGRKGQNRPSSSLVISPLVVFIVVYLSILPFKVYAVVGGLSHEQEYNLGYDVWTERLRYVVVQIKRLLYGVELLLVHVFHFG